MEIKYNINLEIIVTKVMFKKVNLNVCNIYFPSEMNELDRLLKLPHPRLILGDMNSKQSTRSNSK